MIRSRNVWSTNEDGERKLDDSAWLKIYETNRRRCSRTRILHRMYCTTALPSTERLFLSVQLCSEAHRISQSRSLPHYFLVGVRGQRERTYFVSNDLLRSRSGQILSVDGAWLSLATLILLCRHLQSRPFPSSSGLHSRSSPSLATQNQ